MRPSTASIRSSIAPSAPPTASTESLASLIQKKKEAEAVDALQRASVLFLQRLEGLGDDCEAMADAGAGKHAARCTFRRIIADSFSFAVLGDVLAQWPQMFRILGLFRMSRVGRYVSMRVS